MTMVDAEGDYQHIPATPVDVFDVTGAGDTTAAVLAITRALGWSYRNCAQLANVAAGIVVGKSGTATVSGPELARACAAGDSSARGVMSQDQLLAAVTRARSLGERIVFTNGCFDILHAGHVAYLEEARALGDRLIVAVNDDASVTRLKGAGRPVNRIEQRLRVLAGLAAVDWLVEFTEDTPESLLVQLRPEVLVKGGDYAEEEVVGAELVKAYGGEVRVLSLVEDCSTSAILERLNPGS
jgi:D-beta-D-heptose 7-phosphate kinase/D-beta-D-heptose 1-phosphate adenosyltransferase